MRNPGRALHERLERLINTADAACAFVEMVGSIIPTLQQTPGSDTSGLWVLYGYLEGNAQDLVLGILKLEAKFPSGESEVPVDRLARLWHGWLEVTDALDAQLRYLGPIQVLTALFDRSGESDADVKELADLVPTIRLVREVCTQAHTVDLSKLQDSLGDELPSSAGMEALIKEVERGVDLTSSNEHYTFIDGLTALRDGLALSAEMPGADQDQGFIL